MHDLSTIPLAFAYHWHAVLPHACYLAEYGTASSTMHAFYYPFMHLLLNVYDIIGLGMLTVLVAAATTLVWKALQL